MLGKKKIKRIYSFIITDNSLIPLYYRQKAENPFWLVMFIFSRFYFIRRIVASFHQDKFLIIDEIKNSLFSKIDVDLVVKDLEKIGFFRGLQLPHNYVDEILDFANKNECYGEGNLDYPFKFSPSSKPNNPPGYNILRGEYRYTFEQCPAIATIAQDPQILAIAQQYLKTKPVLMNTRLWWNFIVDSNKCDLKRGARTFHYDPDDYCCIIFAFYITDVDVQSGSHICVKGSHKKKKLKRLLSLDLNTPDAGIIADYGKENLVTIEGKSGYGFIEDKFIYHKASSPISKERLILYVQYGFNNYGCVARS